MNINPVAVIADTGVLARFVNHKGQLPSFADLCNQAAKAVIDEFKTYPPASQDIQALEFAVSDASSQIVSAEASDETARSVEQAIMDTVFGLEPELRRP